MPTLRTARKQQKSKEQTTSWKYGLDFCCTIWQPWKVSIAAPQDSNNIRNKRSLLYTLTMLYILDAAPGRSSLLNAVQARQNTGES